MYVRKFEADTLDEALKNIKRELGPDAIILKTITNKGAKGLIKKKRIEITAAISEKNYTNKAQVDSVLNEEQKEKLYQTKSSTMAKIIENYHNHGYNNFTHNRSVKKIDSSDNIKKGLDDFLQVQSPVNSLDYDDNSNEYVYYEKKDVDPLNKKEMNVKNDDQNKNKHEYEHEHEYEQERKSEKEDKNENNNRIILKNSNEIGTSSLISESLNISSNNLKNEKINWSIEKKIQEQASQIKEIKEVVSDLIEYMQFYKRQDVSTGNELPKSVLDIRKQLLGLGITSGFVNKLINSCSNHFNNEQLENYDLIFDYVLKQMSQIIKIKKDINYNKNKKNGITILLSDHSSGQTSLFFKLGVDRKENNNVVLVQSDCRLFSQKNAMSYLNPESNNNYIWNEETISFAQKMFNLKLEKVNSLAEIITLCKKSSEENRPIIIDLKSSPDHIDLVQKMIEGLKGSFFDVEVLATLSSINSESYNQRMLTVYKKIIDGINITHLDQCLDYASLFNLAYQNNDIPHVYYSVGKVIPDDIEIASAERIMASLFRLM